MNETVKMVALSEVVRILADALMEVRRDTLEEAAKVCEDLWPTEHYDPEKSAEERAFRNCATAIRALIDQKPPD